MANIFEQFKLYKHHNELLKKAEGVFPTTQIYNNFKDQLDIALKQGDLSQAEFALETFELMQQNETSPLFYDTLNQRLTDPLFCEFSDLILDITPQYAQAEFTSTAEMNAQLASDFGTEQTIIAAVGEIEKQNVFAPVSSKKVLNIVNGIITNNEVLYTPDGMILDRNQYTTTTLEQARQEAFEENLQQATTSEEVEDVIESFTPDSSTSAIPPIDEAPHSFEDNKEFSMLDASTIKEEAHDITTAIIEERRRGSAANPGEQTLITSQVGADAAEMGLE